MNGGGCLAKKRGGRPPPHYGTLCRTNRTRLIALLRDLIETSSVREDIKGIKENDDDYNDKADKNKNDTYDKDNKVDNKDYKYDKDSSALGLDRDL